MTKLLEAKDTPTPETESLSVKTFRLIDQDLPLWRKELRPEATFLLEKQIVGWLEGDLAAVVGNNGRVHRVLGDDTTDDQTA